MSLGSRVRRLLSGRELKLTAEQSTCWKEQGFVVLPQFFSSDQIVGLNRELDDVWDKRQADDRGLVIDVHIDNSGGQERRIRFRDASDETRTYPYKLNDLYLVSDSVRETVLDQGLVDVVAELLDGPPTICNSLTFERGSQQRFHFDTFFMPPSVPNKMLASWIALEDADDKSGPLRYYPGSHKIPPYHFSHGELSIRVEEMGDFDEYIDKEIADRGLQWTTFPAKAGDVFIWHAQLYHGGAPIDDMSLTRRSLVTHYFRAQDVDANCLEDIGGGRYYLRRDHQATTG